MLRLCHLASIKTLVLLTQVSSNGAVVLFQFGAEINLTATDMLLRRDGKTSGSYEREKIKSKTRLSLY